MARAMVSRYGMEQEVGQASYVAERPRYLDFPGLGPQPREASEETSAAIDKAVKHLVQEAFERAATILKRCEAVHHATAERLIEKETFTEADLEPIRASVNACAPADVEAKPDKGAPPAAPLDDKQPELRLVDFSRLTVERVAPFISRIFQQGSAVLGSASQETGRSSDHERTTIDDRNRGR